MGLRQVKRVCRTTVSGLRGRGEEADLCRVPCQEEARSAPPAEGRPGAAPGVEQGAQVDGGTQQLERVQAPPLLPSLWRCHLLLPHRLLKQPLPLLLCRLGGWRLRPGAEVVRERSESLRPTAQQQAGQRGQRIKDGRGRHLTGLYPTENQGSCRIWAMVALLVGSGVRMRRSRVVSSGLNHGGTWYCANVIFRKRPASDWSSKGNDPLSMTYRMTPRDQMSAGGPARQSGTRVRGGV